jgi:hypothetical protein
MELKIPKLTRNDKIAIAFLVIFVVVMAYPIYKDKEGCEIAQGGYTCDSAENVMIDNCEYWGKWKCDSTADVSLPQIEWYIGNLCEIYKNNHDGSFDCSNLPQACNAISQKTLC